MLVHWLALLPYSKNILSVTVVRVLVFDHQAELF